MENFGLIKFDYSVFDQTTVSFYFLICSNFKWYSIFFILFIVFLSQFSDTFYFIKYIIIIAPPNFVFYIKYVLFLDIKPLKNLFYIFKCHYLFNVSFSVDHDYGYFLAIEKKLVNQSYCKLCIILKWRNFLAQIFLFLIITSFLS